MKTKLKTGDKVYDSALFGDKQGVVVAINDTCSNPLAVKFGEDVYVYTIEGANIYKSNATLSLKPYDKLSDIVPVWEKEVWGLFWDDEDSFKVYGRMDVSLTKEYPFLCIGHGHYKYFKETGKLM